MMFNLDIVWFIITFGFINTNVRLSLFNSCRVAELKDIYISILLTSTILLGHDL